MNKIILNTKAEELAEQAESLQAFSGIKLLHIKRQVAAILSNIGKDGIFDEYTKHDITHIDMMLASLEWIIPDNTKVQLTPSDWLMLTLAIYFHDLGMLVTKDEFSKRKQTRFPIFKSEILAGEWGLDFKDKILSIDGEYAQDRFIYQELVRKTHAERIKHWILDEPNSTFSSNLTVIAEIKTLLIGLDPMFRRDLALVCESHHLSDLEDLDKYKPNQQYGPTGKEKVNLHYAALILRTADLLHITSDRTPSIQFNLINPTDPISQEEWAKQKAVKAVRVKSKNNKEGLPDNSLQSDTFEVIAFFEEEKGFFGLISYLNYAANELKQNFKANELANKQTGQRYEFPWRNIDDTSIETKDFEKKQFEFILDQGKILTLLIGHTLYNDSTVVLRELIQNSIDATKLKKFELSHASNISYRPEIKVKWDRERRELSFADNGTGMTLDIIQNHLLNVGSSRYQDESFKKKYPEFSPISRFGIGLLTCFLIADDIDILTKSSDSEKAILLKIKKVHGKYLLKYISPDKLPEHVAQHGTVVKLYVRSNVKLDNIESEINKWILFPQCDMFLELHDKIVKIGYQDPKQLLEEYLVDIGYDVDDKNVRIKQVTKNGVTMAYALRYREHWKEWEIMQYTDASSKNMPPIGTCIEGIRVDFNSPGLKLRRLLTIVNTSGKGGPKTNVARSNIEASPEQIALLSTIYKLYIEHISEQLQSLRDNGFSISWATNEANYMLNSLFEYGANFYGNSENEIADIACFESVLTDAQLVLMESNKTRELLSITDVKLLDHYWTIDCASYSSANSLIKEVKSSDISALALLETIFGHQESNTKHIENLLCKQTYDSMTTRILSENFQVSSIKIIPEQRRLDLKWTVKHNKIWEEITIIDEQNRHSKSRCFVQLLDFEINDSITQTAINSSDALFILKNSTLNIYLVGLIERLSDKTQENMIALSHVVGLLKEFFTYRNVELSTIEELIENRFMRNGARNLEKIIWSRVDKDELIQTILKTNFIKYDTTIWDRRFSIDY